MSNKRPLRDHPQPIVLIVLHLVSLDELSTADGIIVV